MSTRVYKVKNTSTVFLNMSNEHMDIKIKIFLYTRNKHVDTKIKNTVSFPWPGGSVG